MATSHDAATSVRGEVAPYEPIESVKQIRRHPTVFIAASVFCMPPMVTCCAISGESAVSTDKGDAKFHTAVSGPACSLNSRSMPSGSRTSTPPTRVCATSFTLLGRCSRRSAAMTMEPALRSAWQSRLPTAPAAPITRVLEGIFLEPQMD